MLEQNVRKEISDAQKETSIDSQDQEVAKIFGQGCKLIKGIVIEGHRMANVSYSKISYYNVNQIWLHFKRGFSSSYRPPSATLISLRS